MVNAIVTLYDDLLTSPLFYIDVNFGLDYWREERLIRKDRVEVLSKVLIEAYICPLNHSKHIEGVVLQRSYQVSNEAELIFLN